MKGIVTLFCCFSICPVPGLAQKKSSGPIMTDQQFVEFAGQTDMVDANLGQLASRITPSQSIKSYAEKLVSDQTEDFRELSKAARQASLSVPNAIDKQHDRTMIDPFQKLKGTSFDHRFAKDMVAEDMKSIDIYKREAAEAHSQALRSYAEEALPILQGQLAAAEKMETMKAPAKKG